MTIGFLRQPGGSAARTTDNLRSTGKDGQVRLRQVWCQAVRVRLWSRFPDAKPTALPAVSDSQRVSRATMPPELTRDPRSVGDLPRYRGWPRCGRPDRHRETGHRERHGLVAVPGLTESRANPTLQRRPLAVSVAAVIVVLVVWNVLSNTLPPGGQLPISVIGAAGLVLIARRSGLEWSDLGLARKNLGDGVRVGAIAAGVLVLALITAAAIPDTRTVLADGRFVGMELPRALYEMLVRIPLAVALTEEIAFRGVLLGMLMVRTTALRAVVISSVMFGLWHLLPGMSALETVSGIVEMSSTGVEMGLVAVQVVVTGLAGVVFSWLRLRGGHVASSILVHAPLNSVSFAIGWLAVQNTSF